MRNLQARIKLYRLPDEADLPGEIIGDQRCRLHTSRMTAVALPR